jgi:hypothetical protein
VPADVTAGEVATMLGRASLAVVRMNSGDPRYHAAAAMSTADATAAARTAREPSMCVVSV